MKRLIVRSTICVAVVTVLASCGGGGRGGGKSCTLNSECAAGEFCKFDAGSSGAVEGSCETIALACDTVPVQPVSTCDGLSFFNDCYAGESGQSVRATGNCA